MGERVLNTDEALRFFRVLHEPEDFEAMAGLPERIGRYRVLSELGSGGMARVFVAEQESPRRRIALKVLNIAAADGAAQRLQTEAEVLAELTHPAIATVHEFGIWRGAGQLTPFIAMELVPGARSIIAHARDERLTLNERLGLMVEVCDALQHAHQRGVIHRDLKPENILVGEDGRPRVIDFGIARLTGADSGLTIDRQVLGTPHYVSPEQIVHGSSAADVRSDIYALGCVLYELLCGRRMWQEAGDSLAAVIRAAMEFEPPSPRSIDPSIPKDVEAVVHKAIRREPAQRYQSAHELTEELRRCLRGEPVSARRPGPWARSMRWLGRHPIVGTVAACVLIFASALGLTAGAVWWLNAVPHRVEIYGADPNSVVVNSRSGAVVGRIRFEHPVMHVRMVSSSDGYSGGQLIVAGLNHANSESGSPVIQTMEVGRWSARIARPKWSWHPAYPDWSTEERPGENRGAFFTSSHILVARVFPKSVEPEPQIVTVTHHRPFSPTVIAVHSMDGRLLDEVWHDGRLFQIEWIERHEHFLCLGENSEVLWSDRVQEVPFDKDTGSPVVAFALRPELGRSDALLRPGCPRSDVEPLWYRVLLASEEQVFLSQIRWVQVRRSDSDPESARAVTMAGDMSGGEGSPRYFGWAWRIEADGRITPKYEIDQTFAARQTEPRLPRLDQLYWGDLPPVKPGRRPIERARERAERPEP